MSKEVGSVEATGEPTNASAARGTTPTLVVRRPDDGGRPEIPVMTLRSHSRGGRSSACAQEPSSQAGSYPTSKENLGVHSTRQEKSGPEPEMHSNHTNCPTDPTSVGTGIDLQPPVSNLTTTAPTVPVITDTHPPVNTTDTQHAREVSTGTHHQPQTQVFTSYRTFVIVALFIHPNHSISQSSCWVI